MQELNLELRLRRHARRPGSPTAVVATLWSASRAFFARDANGPRTWNRLRSSTKKAWLRRTIQRLTDHLSTGGAARVTYPLRHELEGPILAALSQLQHLRELGLVWVPEVADSVDAAMAFDGTVGEMSRGVIDAPTLLVTVGDVMLLDRLTNLLVALEPQRTPPRLVVVLESIEPRLEFAMGHAAAAVVRRGCAAVVRIPYDRVEALGALLNGDLPLTEIVRSIKGSSIAALAIDGEVRLSVVRGLLLAPRDVLSGRSIEQVLSLKPRPPRTELESMLAESAGAALRRLRDDVQAFAQRSAPPPLDKGFEAIVAWALDREHRRERTPEDLLGVLRAAAVPLRWLSRTSPQVAEPDSAEDDPPLAMPARGLRARWLRMRHPVEGALLAGAPYSLEVSVGFTGDERQPRTVPLLLSPDTMPGEAHDLDIEVVVYARSSDFDLDERRLRLRLPRFDESEWLRFVITPRPGDARDIVPPPRDVRQLRIVAYHGSRLLQSVLLTVEVLGEPWMANASAPPRYTLDYVASSELLTVDRGERPAMSLWVNEGPGATHWIGFRTEGAEAQDEPIEIDDDALAQRMHDAMECLHLKPDLDTAGARHAAEARLLKLAEVGRKAFDTLLGGARNPAAMRSLRARLAGFDSLIEINRLRVTSPGLPWQIVYDLPLDRASVPGLCAEYSAQVDAARAGGPSLLSPQACASQASCPHRATFTGDLTLLRTDMATQAVCPYGFWGLRHRMVQPLGARTDDARDAEPAPMSTREANGARGVTVGYFEFDNTPDHLTRLHDLGRVHQARVRPAGRRQQICELLMASGDADAIVYFYCHGAYPENEFHLRVGDDAQPRQYVGHRFFLDKCHWPHNPVIILNGCQTLAIRPSDTAIHLFLQALRYAGAGAILGTEVAMSTEFAAAIGEQVIDGLLQERTLESIMVDVRRRQLSMMSVTGLAYNVYAAAGFRLGATTSANSPSG